MPFTPKFRGEIFSLAKSAAMKRKEEADSKAACKLLALEAEDSKAACKVLALEAAYERVHLHRKAQAMAEQLRIEKERLLEKCIGESTPPKNLRSGYYR